MGDDSAQNIVASVSDEELVKALDLAAVDIGAGCDGVINRALHENARFALIMRLAALRGQAERRLDDAKALAEAGDNAIARATAAEQRADRLLHGATVLTREINDALCALLSVSREDYYAAGVEDRPHLPSVAADVMQRLATAEKRAAEAEAGERDLWERVSKMERAHAASVKAAEEQANEMKLPWSGLDPLQIERDEARQCCDANTSAYRELEKAAICLCEGAEKHGLMDIAKDFRDALAAMQLRAETWTPIYDVEARVAKAAAEECKRCATIADAEGKRLMREADLAQPGDQPGEQRAGARLVATMFDACAETAGRIEHLIRTTAETYS